MNNLVDLEKEMFVRDVYRYFPNNRLELLDIIAKKLKENIYEPYLLDIDTSKVTSFADLFCYVNWNSISGGTIDTTKIIKLDLRTWKTSSVLSFDSMFYRCESLEEIIGVDSWDISNGVNFSLMFAHCKSLHNLDIDNWKDNKYCNKYNMFEDCYKRPSWHTFPF